MEWCLLRMECDSIAEMEGNREVGKGQMGRSRRPCFVQTRTVSTSPVMHQPRIIHRRRPPVQSYCTSDLSLAFNHRPSLSDLASISTGAAPAENRYW